MMMEKRTVPRLAHGEKKGEKGGGEHVMAATIRFTDGLGLKRGIEIFMRHGDAVPTGNPDTYYVSKRIVTLLKNENVPFEKVDPEKYGLMRVTEEMFANLRKATEESRMGKLLQVTDPKSLDDIIDTGKDRT